MSTSYQLKCGYVRKQMFSAVSILRLRGECAGFRETRAQIMAIQPRDDDVVVHKSPREDDEGDYEEL